VYGPVLNSAAGEPATNRQRAKHVETDSVRPGAKSARRAGKFAAARPTRSSRPGAPKQKPDPPKANRACRRSNSFFALDHFAGDNHPASTVLTVRAEVNFELRVVVIILLTGFRRKRLLSET